jgi:hypothetical protein
MDTTFTQRGVLPRPRRRSRVVVIGALMASTALALSLVNGVPAEAASSVGIFSDSRSPRTSVAKGITKSVELGVKFSSSRSGTITGLQFYRSKKQTGAYPATLWTSKGAVLARATFPKSKKVGWQTVKLAKPVHITAGRTYVASYLAKKGKPALTRKAFAHAYTRNGLTIPKNGGRYKYTSKSSLPTHSTKGTDYLVDVVFVPDGSTSTPAPNLSAPGESPSPNTDGTVLNLPREAWWGGSAYYSKFSKASAAGWTDPSHFPIAVFYGKPEHASSLASIGINTYMGAEHDGSKVSAMTNAGISVVAQSEWTAAEVGTDPKVVGWFLSDECEMGYSGCPEDETGALAQQTKYAATARARNDGRFLQANFGNGVLGTWWAPKTMSSQLALLDVSSVDKYAYTSPPVRREIERSPYWTQGNSERSIAYGWLQDRMETYASPAASKPNWVFVETAKPLLDESDATSIDPAEISGAVWNALIHGAGGIAYFQHNNNGTCGNYSLMDCANSRAAVAKVDAEVKSLARVLNSQPYTWNFGSGLQTSLRATGGYAYVLAMTDGGTGSRTFTLPAGISGTSVEVVGEGRSLPVTNGKFTDSFANEYTHHVYRVVI